MIAAVGTFAAAVLFLFNPTDYPIYPICLFHATTGLLCPGCGSLRGMHQLLHGHLLVALRSNALLMGGFLAMAVHGVRWVATKPPRLPLRFRIEPAWLWRILVLMFVFSIVRNLPLFWWLRP